MRKILPLALFVCVVALTGCNQFFPTPGHDPFDPMKVVVASPQSSIVAGGTLQLTVTVTGNGPSTSEWSVNGIPGGNSTYGTISATSLYSAPNVVPANPNVLITATSTANPSATASVSILIHGPTVELVSIACNPALILNNQTAQCAATVQGEGNFTSAVTWYVNNVAGGNSAVGSISSQGIYQAPDPILSTPINISAISQQDNTTQGSANISLSYPLPVLNTATPTNFLWMSSGAQIQIAGSNFSHASSVIIGGIAVPTTYVSNSQLSANVPASALQNVGTLQVAVNTPAPGGGATASSALQVAGGSMVINIQGLPAGATTQAQITGPNGFSNSITSTRTLNGLAAGVYTIQAAPGDDGPATYPAAQATQTAAIADLNPISVSVNYSTGIIKAAKVLDSDGLNSLAFVAGEQAFTVSSASAIGMSLIASDVLIIPDCPAVPGGGIVRVITASQNADQVVVTYNPGNLSDIYTQASVQFSQDIGADQVASIQTLMRGVTILSRKRSQEELAVAADISSPCAGNPLTIGFDDAEFDIDANGDLVTKGNNAGSGVTVGGHINGTLQLCPTITFSMSDIDSASMMVTLNEQSHLAVTFVAGLQGHAVLLSDFHVLDLKMMPIPIGPTGGLVNITPEVTVDLGVEGTLTLNVTLGATQSTTETFGVQYANGQTSWINNPPVNNFSYDPIVIDGALTADVYVKPKIRAVLNAGLFGWNAAEIDPYIGLKGYVELDASLTDNPWWKLYGGLNAEAGVDFSVLFGLKHVSFDESLDLWKYPIRDSNGPYKLTPSITSILPSPLISQAASQQITLNGTGFSSNMVVKYCHLGTCTQTTIPSPGISTAAYFAIINKPGVWTFQAMDSDQSLSPIVPVTVQPPSVVPHIDSVSPVFLQMSSNNTTLTLAGSGFQPGLTVRLCHTVCYTPLSGAQILSVTPDGKQATVQAELGSSGSWTAEIFNPDGGISNELPFTVQPAFSAILSSGAGIVGTTAFTISGYGATPNSTVTRNTTFPNGTTQNSTLATNSMGEFLVPSFIPSVAGPYVERFTDDTTGRKTPAVSYIVSNNTPSGTYTLGTNQSTINVTAGNSNSFILTATSTGGFNGTVTISPINVSGITGSWSSSSITLTSGSQGTSTYSFSTSSSTPAGNYQLAIQTSSGSLTQNTSVTVVVSASSGTPSYSVSMNGSGQSITAGNSATFSLTATSINGFSNTVSLPQASMSIIGASSSWSPSSISITPSNQGSSTLTVYTSTSTPTGTYSITEYMPNGQSAYVLLTVTSSSGGTQTGPTAQFTMSSPGVSTVSNGGTLSVTAPSGGSVSVTLTSTSIKGSANITNYAWKSNGGSICVNNSTCTYSFSSGSYTIALTVTDANGRTSPATGYVNVSIQQTITGPTAHFTMTGQGQTFNDGGTLLLTLGVGATALVSTANTSIKGSAPITTYLWTFNGTQQCGNSPTCNNNILAQAGGGTVTITLTVTDSNGKQSSPATGTVFVTIPTVTARVTGTTCHGSVPGSVPEIDLSFTVSGGTSSTFDIYRNGTLLYADNYGTTTFQNYGSNLTPGQTFSYYFVVHLAAGGTATSNTVSAVAPSNCH